MDFQFLYLHICMLLLLKVLFEPDLSITAAVEQEIRV